MINLQQDCIKFYSDLKGGVKNVNNIFNNISNKEKILFSG
ncbi:hypothetical protein CPAST_c10490 [Clostridium pasteurianum DSM 525 = ATCC 6013]|uniref:Uncharacterized protein n=1 Tax=Clostridium pasteurianum DSM 525 = ATCC 6013 TaxID=1262449 RepID=A0A0H3J1B0_CLOPA|nr:hypothetical protein CPAST_c10490 [Clostridium pasteurianum DSM 525 = ATCC 6013]AJA51137.1 hypothetical protein CLPA_c10490 [Clostridium pasteurianum DSM 525 = ATCC 6013]KRU12855.1 hypothetical protein CP6013_02103 [Clostridium pasteurianum DSM 525 = ATCC 6013]